MLKIQHEVYKAKSVPMASRAPRIPSPSAQEGLAAAMARTARGASSTSAMERGTARGVSSTAHLAHTRKQAVVSVANVKPRTRIQIVADAVERDPACKGKSALALALLANDEFASVPGAGLVKMIRQMKAGQAGDMFKDLQLGVISAAASARVWDKAIAATCGRTK